MLLKKYQTISKASFFLSSKSLLSLYYTLVFPFLIYCKIAWSLTYRSNLNRLLYIYRNASSESFLESILPILHLYFGLLISLIFLTPTRSLLLVLCTRITITTDHISVEPTLKSSQSFSWDLNYGTPFPLSSAADKVPALDSRHH